MNIWRNATRGLRRLFRPETSQQDLDDEVRDYFASAVDSYVRAGLTPEEAARQVRLTFGTATAARDEASGWGWEIKIEMLVRDLRYAVRTLRNSPVFALVAILSLGVGIGATTTAFSVIDAFDFRPLPFRDADRLVWLAETTPHDYDICASCAWWTSGPTTLAWTAQTRSFDRVAAVTNDEFSWRHGDVTESVPGDQATPGFFAFLGSRPLLGREFDAADTASDAASVAIVSYEFWKTRLDGDPQIVGSTLRSHGRGPTTSSTPVTVVGVLPPGFRFRDESPIWTPLRLDANSKRTNRETIVVGHLADGHTLAGANTELQTITARLALSDPVDFRGWTATAQPIRTLLTTGAAKSRFVLFAITVLVLLVAVLNVAGLFVGRAAARQSEFAMRTALGASRTQLVRQMLVEGSCIGVAGGLVGVLLALWAVRFLPQWLSLDSSGLVVGVDHRMLAFVTALSLVVGIGAALVPAIRVASTDLNGAFRTRVGGGGTQRNRTSSVLIALQISLALVLLTAAGLLSRDFVELRYLDLGYDPYNLYSTSLAVADSRSVTPEQWAAIAESTRERLAALPGVASVSIEHQSAIHPKIVRPADQAKPLQLSTEPMAKAVDPAFFTTYGTRIRIGRSFTANDRHTTPLVAIVNKAAADAFWPGENPLGRQVFVGDSNSVGELLTVVGVTDNVERDELRSRHWPIVYRPFQQAKIYHAGGSLHLRLVDRESNVLGAAEMIIHQETGAPATPLQSEEAALGTRLLPRRFNAIALDLFAGFGLLLAAIGIYGSVSYAVTQRTREIGIRIALGARRGNVIGLVAQRVALLTIVGVLAGIAGAFVLTRALRSFMAGTSVMNPWVFAGSVMLLVGVALLATLLPARRATRVDAVIALRGE